MIKILKVIYFLLIIIISSIGIYFCYDKINYNAEYVTTEGTVSKNSICEDVDIFNSNNDKIGKRNSCITFIKYPPALSSTGASYDENVRAYNSLFRTQKKYSENDKIKVSYIPIKNKEIDTSKLDLIPTKNLWIAIIIFGIAILFSIIFLIFINK